MTNKLTRPTGNFVYGVHTVSAVMRYQPERGKKLFIARKSGIDELIESAKRESIATEFIDRQKLQKKFGIESDAQGVVLECAPFIYKNLDELIESGAKTLILLDLLQDAVNIGKIARSADCFGADGIVILKDRSAQVNAAAEKAAVGTLSKIPVARATNLSAVISKLKERDFFIYGADVDGDRTLNQCDFADKVALVIGQEGCGLRELTKKACDVMVRIPMANPDACLNAADSALLLLYELKNRQQ